MTVRWGMIGCGDVTERKSGPAYRLAPGSSLVGVWARRPEQARDYAGRHGVPRAFADLEEMIAGPDIDAVYVATPPHTHPDFAAQVALAGKPCCVEKPIANSYAEALDMVQTFDNAGQPLFVAYYRRALPRFVQIKRWLDDGAVGEVRHIEWRLTRRMSEGDRAGAPNWRVDAEAAPGGYFDDLACHGLDLFDHLLGPIARVAGHTAHQAAGYAPPDAVTASWVHEGGVTGSASWTFAADCNDDVVTIVGSAGRLTFSVFEETPLRLMGQQAATHAIPNDDPVQLSFVANVVQALNGAAPALSTGQSALRTAWVTDRIFGRIEHDTRGSAGGP